MDDSIGKFILDKLDKLDDKVDDIKSQGLENKLKLEDQEHNVKRTAEQCEDMNSKLGEYNEQLKVHIRRSELLEQQQLQLHAKVEPVIQLHNNEEIVERYISEKWKDRVKMLTGVSTALGVIWALIKLYGLI